METSSATNTPGPLPPTLFNIYRTYKHETSIVIGWLFSFDKAADSNSIPNSKHDGNPAQQEMTVRQIADRARQAASIGKRPPKGIETAFKMVILNRNRMTKHYETLPSSTQGVQDSTERHRVFNETLAEAYGLLFPKKKRNRKNNKSAPKKLPDPPTTTPVNTFEALADLIEQEEESTISASDYWGKDVHERTAKRSAIAEDPIENSIARQAYLAEIQAIVETVKTIWTSFATGGISLTAAGWLTNLAQSLVRSLSPDKAVPTSFEEVLFCNILPDEDEDCGDLTKCGGMRAGLTVEELASIDFSKIATSPSFAELTHGGGLVWPLELVHDFRAGKTLPQSTETERRRFESFFRTACEDNKAKEAFAASVTQHAKDSPQLTDGESLFQVATICTDRYAHDRLLVATMIKSASRHPAYEEHQPRTAIDEANASLASLATEHIQHPSTIPLLRDLKGQGIPIPAVVAAHLLLESGRSFLHECEKTGRAPPNCRIMMLSHANEVRSAITHLVHKDRPVVAFEKTNATMLKVMILKLDVLLSDKVFDLYSQSPWVTGSQMAAISDWSLFVGLELLSEGDCFGAVIHLYNMLQQLDVKCKRIPILEHLQTLFKSKVFAGKSEPQRSFSSIFELFCGGAKILQAQGVRLLHRSKPKETRDSPKFSKISLAEMHSSTTQSFFHLYMPSAKFWTRLTDNPRIVQRYTTHENLFAQFPPSDTIRRAEEIIRPEYEGAFPIARLNCFAVLSLCQDIMLAIVARFQVLGTAAWPPGMDDIGSPWLLYIPTGIEPYVKIEHAVKCVRMTMRLIDGLLDGYALTRKRSDVGYGKMWKEHPDVMRPVVVMRDTIAEVCEGKKVEDFLWKNM